MGAFWETEKRRIRRRRRIGLWSWKEGDESEGAKCWREDWHYCCLDSFPTGEERAFTSSFLICFYFILFYLLFWWFGLDFLDKSHRYFSIPSVFSSATNSFSLSPPFSSYAHFYSRSYGENLISSLSSSKEKFKLFTYFMCYNIFNNIKYYFFTICCYNILYYF